MHRSRFPVKIHRTFHHPSLSLLVKPLLAKIPVSRQIFLQRALGLKVGSLVSLLVLHQQPAWRYPSAGDECCDISTSTQLYRRLRMSSKGYALFAVLYLNGGSLSVRFSSQRTLVLVLFSLDPVQFSVLDPYRQRLNFSLTNFG